MSAVSDSLHEQAHRHLLLHFTRNGAYRPARREPARARARRGRRTSSTPKATATSTGCRRCSAARSATRTARRWPRSAGAQLSTLAFNTNWATAHPPAIELAAALAERAPGDLNRVFFTNGGSESVEAAWKLVRQYHLARGRAAAHEGDRARRSPTTASRSAPCRSPACADEGAVRRRRRSRWSASRTPTASATRRRDEARSARGCWTSSSGRSSRPGPRRSRW